ncbi:acyl-CoA dehydrogenase family protein [Pseudomonas typographi]|nr:acyl-CoA dehydrogenase family protein [Pseudomonas typographi]
MNEPMHDVDLAERRERVTMLRDSAAALVPADGDLRRVRAWRFAGNGLDAQAWALVCEMGWPGLRLAEEQGGSGLGLCEYVALLEELGKGLAPEPLNEVACLVSLLPAEWREPVLRGERLVLPGHGAGLVADHQGRLLGQAKVSLGKAAHGWLLMNEDSAWLVDAQGLEGQALATQDGGHVLALALNGVPAQRLASSPEQLRRVRDEAALGVAAYLLGCMQGAFARTLDYLKVRKQFGREIGSFQALQHRMVDLHIQIELSRALVEETAACLDRSVAPGEAQRRIYATRVQAGDAALRVCREAIQLHGAIGYTDEADIGLFLRRVLVAASAWGTQGGYRQGYARLIAEEAFNG